MEEEETSTDQKWLSRGSFAEQAMKHRVVSSASLDFGQNKIGGRTYPTGQSGRTLNFASRHKQLTTSSLSLS
jgi:hypothetical protein